MAWTLDGQSSVSALCWMITMYEDQYSGQSSHDSSARAGCAKSPSLVFRMHYSVEYRLRLAILSWYLSTEYIRKPFISAFPHFRLSHSYSLNPCPKVY